MSNTRQIQGYSDSDLVTWLNGDDVKYPYDGRSYADIGGVEVFTKDEDGNPGHYYATSGDWVTKHPNGTVSITPWEEVRDPAWQRGEEQESSTQYRKHRWTRQREWA